MPILEKRRQIEKWFASDKNFDQLYPLTIRTHSRKHWTPLLIAKMAADFLATESNTRVLDIGSGVGKFCLAAAYYKPKAFFYGVEQRKYLIQYADSAKEILDPENVLFIPGNFTQLDFRQYDHFYFYNSFYENLSGTEKIDNSIEYSGELFNYYNRYLYKQLEQKPAGTKLVTFHSLEDEIPRDYHEVNAAIDNLLKFWIKI